MLTGDETLPSSFRDPSGFVFTRDGVVHRQINKGYASNYRHLMESGLYDALVHKGWLIAHQERPELTPADAFLVLEPEQIRYVSHPFEWSFAQLKAAATLTLDIQKLALEFDMSLKDASAYNIQFRGSRPVFIDTLSFERLREDEPWVAYRQYCQHFLAPLTLMTYSDPRTRVLQMGFIDGLPLDLASSLLPARSRLRYSTLAHIHLHARSQTRHAGAGGAAPQRKMNGALLRALLASLASATSKCALAAKRKTEWGDYYGDTNYSSDAMSGKEVLVDELLARHVPDDGIVHDLGANTGRFSRIALKHAGYVVSHDIDDLAVERNFEAAVGERADGLADRLLPLVLDLTNPTPAIGWDHRERASFKERCAADVVLALALVHHIALSNNTPLNHIADFLADIGRVAIIEFVPKTDSQVQRLLATREDIFSDYDEAHFEAAFARHFDMTEKHALPGSERTMYAFTRRRC